MPILPIHTIEQYNCLFKPWPSYEFVLMIWYSPLYEERYMNQFSNDERKNRERKFNNHLRYLDRLSNSYKYAHILFVEINADIINNTCTTNQKVFVNGSLPNIMLLENGNWVRKFSIATGYDSDALLQIKNMLNYTLK